MDVLLICTIDIITINDFFINVLIMTKPFWDINEDHIIIDGVRVKNIERGLQSAVRDMKYLQTLFNYLSDTSKNYYVYGNLTKYELGGLKLFIDTPHVLMEIDPHDDQFNGLNKPKNVRRHNVKPHGTDGNLRADKKCVMFRVRDQNMNRMHSTESLTMLFIHEMSHTMANHVRWRPDDHGEDFKIYQRLITKWFMVAGCMSGEKYT